MIAENWTKGVSPKEYWEQVSIYTDMAVEMAKADIGRLNELIDHLDNLPQPTFEKILEYLSSEKIVATPEGERIDLWTGLVKFVSKHKRFAKAKWALSPEMLGRIENVTNALAPQNQLNLYRGLFCNRDLDFYPGEGNWREQHEELEKRRQKAIKAILDSAGIDTVVQFAETVESPSKAGFSLGAAAECETDTSVLPKLLEVEDKNLAQFVGGYVWGRYQSNRWAWVDGIDIDGWSNSQRAQLLIYLPFTGETWKRAKQWLGEGEEIYWKRASVNPFQAESELNEAIYKLIEYGRPNAAISCLSRVIYEKQPLNKDQAVKALLAAVSSGEPSGTMDVYETVEIIKALQSDPDTNPDDLFRIEWLYLPVLDRYHKASPQLLEKRLASDPDFFCEVIRYIYRSKNETKSEKDPTEAEKAIASNAYRLLHEWRMPPGKQSDGVFSEEHFKQWLESVEKVCRESGHLDVAMTHVGSVLIYSPPDPDNLWIHRAVAEALNGRRDEAEKMRNGFRMAVFNSRGAHWVDPTGKPERELASKYRKEGEEVENVGYARLASTLKAIAEVYTNEAKRIANENQQEGGE